MLRNFMKSRHATRGMTLVELLLVMAIFSIVMMAVMSLFIPAVKSTAVQTQVTDVQSNLRLALNRMTQDLLTAGFLIGANDPIFFEGDVNPDDPDDFTIRTRAVGSGFARVIDATSSVLTLSQPAMVDNFPLHSKVRLFESVTATELEGVVYEVTAKGADTLTINPSAGVTIPDETVVIRIRDNAQPAMQTIRYRLIDEDGDGTSDTLARIVNGETQLLARNLTGVTFAYDYSPTGRVKEVSVALEGRTEAVGAANEAVGKEQVRALQTTVTLRNAF